MHNDSHCPTYVIPIFIEISIEISLITSCVSGRGYKNGAACVCLSVSVCEHSHGWTDWHTVTKFGTGIDLDDILDNFVGQGHRSKVKVTRSKNVISMIFSIVCKDTKYDVMVWCLDVIWHHVTSRLDTISNWFCTRAVQQHISVF